MRTSQPCLLDVQHGANTAGNDFGRGVRHLEQPGGLGHHVYRVEVRLLDQLCRERNTVLLMMALEGSIADPVIEKADIARAGGCRCKRLHGSHAGGAVDPYSTAGELPNHAGKGLPMLADRNLNGQMLVSQVLLKAVRLA